MTVGKELRAHIKESHYAQRHIRRWSTKVVKASKSPSLPLMLLFVFLMHM